MKRLLALALALLAGLAIPGTAVAVPQPLADVIVVLKSQADIGGLRIADRPARVAAVVRTLHAHADRTQKDLRKLLSGRQVEDVTPLWIVNAIRLRATPAVLRELAARPEVREIQPNTTVQAPATVTTSTVEPNLSVVRAPAMWDMGFRGQGVVVATMDTGVDSSHPDLSSRWRGGANSWYDPNGQHSTPTDVNGHGTQTMGVMVGATTGVAPDAKWIAVKIFNDRGTATTTGIHQGFQWLLDPDGNPATADAPNVVNASWTMSGAGCTLTFQPDLRTLRSAGILPVFAAGNYGPSAGTIYSPANLPEAFAVGDTDNTDALDPYSSRGPSACAGAVAPKLVAPGVGIRTTDLYGLYATDTGTSVAAPHVAGALALLLNAFPGLSADRQETALMNGAVPLGAANDYGRGRLDILSAYQWLVSTPDFTLTTTPASVTTAAGSAVSYDITVSGINGFASDVSLSLSGLTSAEASWSFTPPVLSNGSSRLTVTTNAGIAAGSHPLTVTGTSGSITHTATMGLTIQAPPDFSLAATPSSRTLDAGTAATYTVGIGSLNGFTGDVSLSLTGLPAAVGNRGFAPASVNTAGNAQLTVSTLTSAPAGTYPLTITGSSGGVTHSATVTLTVNPRDFALSVSPVSVTVTRGQTASYTMSTSAVGGFTGPVSLSSSGAPSGSTPSFSVNPVAVPGSSMFRVKTGSFTPRGTYTLRITGVNGSLSHQITVTLVVR